jgi:Cysteine-rich secretory protein family
MRNKTLFLLLALIIGIVISGYCQEGRTIYKDTAFISAILEHHNSYRSALQLPALQWSPALASDALAWAKHLADIDKGQHNQEIIGKEGENLFWGTANAFSFGDMVDMWGGEKKSFREGVFPDNKANRTAVVGHYTQLVWRNTQAVGCALVSNGRNDYLVCRYSPAGNVIGEKPY